MDKKIITSSVQGIVTTVESYGLFLELENNKKGFLPKENMNIGKKKKLKDIFSEGFIIKGRIITEKKDYYVLSQKEEVKIENNAVRTSTKKESTKKDRSKKIKAGNKKVDKPKNEPKNKKNPKESPVEQEKKSEKTTLKDLEKLTRFGNIKISVSKNKKEQDKLISQEEEQKIQLKEVPKNLLENIITTTKKSMDSFERVKNILTEKGYIND